MSDVDGTESVTRYAEADSTGYVVRVSVLDPEAEPMLSKAGYHSETVLYTVFAGAEVYSDHDRHRLVRSLPGENSWLHDDLKGMKNRLLDGDDE